jgi:hypothetical protein
LQGIEMKSAPMAPRHGSRDVPGEDYGIRGDTKEEGSDEGAGED